MKCRIVQIEDYYKGQILVPVVSYRDGKEIKDGFEWQDIYEGEKYANHFAAKYATKLYVKEVVRKPCIIEEFEL